MKFVKGNVILTTNNPFVIDQMKKNGYQEYIENAKDETVETPEIPKEDKTQKKKKK